MGFARTARLIFLLFLFAPGGGAVALGQDYPSRLIRVIVPFPAGGTLDIAARVTGDQMALQLRQPLMIDNRGGANGIIGTDAVAKAAPDGYTLLEVTASFVVNALVHRKLPYDVARDFVPVTDIGRSSGYLLMVPASLPVRSLAEFIDASRKPDTHWHYASPGFGNTLHLAAELFKVKTHARLAHVPYKGVAPAITALIAGEVQMSIMPPLMGLEYVRAGNVKALAFTGSSRLPDLPDIPTLAEAGVADLVMEGAWLGLFAPAGTPRPIIERLQREMRKALAVPRVAEALRQGGYEPAGSTPDEFAQFVRDEMKRYTDIVRAAKIEPE
jgi:tripartite-type tricarboxylate transporter receptor subunit TctC